MAMARPKTPMQRTQTVEDLPPQFKDAVPTLLAYGPIDKGAPTKATRKR